MTKSWDPDAETLTDVRRRLLDGQSSRDIADNYGVGRKTIERYAKGIHGDGIEAAIEPIRSLNGSGSMWVRAEVVADE